MRHACASQLACMQLSRLDACLSSTPRFCTRSFGRKFPFLALRCRHTSNRLTPAMSAALICCQLQLCPLPRQATYHVQQLKPGQHCSGLRPVSTSLNLGQMCAQRAQRHFTIAEAHVSPAPKPARASCAKHKDLSGSVACSRHHMRGCPSQLILHGLSKMQQN